MNQKIKVVIIDDEVLAIQLIRNYLKDQPDIEVVAECQNGFEGVKAIHELQPDLIFLDIMMPKLSGFEMLEILDDPPVIIFSTAYQSHAIEAFEKNAIDYLLKPYDKSRLLSALEKAREQLDSRHRQTPELAHLIKYHQETGELHRVVVRQGARINIIPIDKILYLEAMDDYVAIHTANGKFLKQQTMKYYQEHLPKKEFARIHRSFLLALGHLARLEPYGKDSHVAILKDGSELSVSRSGYTRLKEMLEF